MRLNLFIAKSGFASRRKADNLISEGKVAVNARRVLEPFFQVKVSDEVKVFGKRLKLKEHTYLLVNKPIGVTTTLSDKFATETIVDFIPEKYRGVYPVGRLDKGSHGLLILTNDGDFCYKLTHPKFAVEKEYLVELNGVFSVSGRQKAKRGIRDEGEQLRVKKIKIIKKDQKSTLCRVVITEGRKRHLRRLFKALGYVVRDLKRVRVGDLTLGSLKLGKCRILEKDELKKALANN